MSVRNTLPVVPTTVTMPMAKAIQRTNVRFIEES
jgi:hypothetical protein